MTPSAKVFAYIDKALEHVERAEVEFIHVGVLGCASRLYYACLHVTTAFVLLKEHSHSVSSNAASHRARVNIFNQHYNRTKKTAIYKKANNMINFTNWRIAREYADYDIYDSTNHIHRLNEISQHVEEMIDFINAHLINMNNKHGCSYIAVTFAQDQLVQQAKQSPEVE